MRAQPETLYHYTTVEGLLGIVRSRSLWVTDVEFMNDAQELRFGRPELRAALVERADRLCPPGSEDGGPDCSKATLLRSAAEHLDQPGGIFASRQWHAVYVACFCESEDLLSQWRGYGASGGFAIGFRRSSLEALEHAARSSLDERLATLLAGSQEGVEHPSSPGTPTDIRLARVSYGDEAVDRVVADVLSRIAQEPTDHPGAEGHYRSKTVLLPSLATIKHGSFREEQEWRLIISASFGEASVAFRSAHLGLIPYVELPLPERAIASVVVGPGEQRELRRHGVERLLDENGLEDVEVRDTAAPFRG